MTEKPAGKRNDWLFFSKETTEETAVLSVFPWISV
jgi:hypothetical protein